MPNAAFEFVGLGRAVGAALIGGYALIKHFQVHGVANEFVQKFQNPFGDHLGQAVDQFNQLVSAGLLDKASAQQMRDEIANMTGQFDQTIEDFKKKGSKQKKVGTQARKTMDDDFGSKNPDGSIKQWGRLLGGMDSVIQGLPG